MKIRRSMLLSAVSAIMMSGGAAQAVVFDLYNDTNGYSGTGEELANALITPGTGIYLLSSEYVGNFDGSGSVPPEAGFSDGEQENPVPTDYGSGSFYYGLNLGDGLTLPDGILLTSGYAAPPETNTDTGFTGYASGLGDAGLDNLIAAAGFTDVTWDSTVLSFDFMVDPGINAVSFDFMFGSDEYPEYADEFPDIAAIFVDGVNYAGFADGSLLNVRSGTIAGGNFIDNDTSPMYPIEYDGISVPLTAVGLLDPSLDIHNVKIAISDTNDPILDSGIFVSNMQGFTIGCGFSPNEPCMPIPGDDPSDGFDFVINVGDTGFGIDPTQPIYIDPIVSVGYIYESTINFATVSLPVLPEGDNLYDIYAWDSGSFVFLDTVAAGDTYSFLPLYANGVSKFQVLGIEPQNLLDPSDPYAFVTGVTFISGGAPDIKMIPISQNYTVPNPGIPALFLLGLGALFAARRRV